MANGFSSSPFVLPNMYPSPGETMQNMVAYKERDKERAYREQKDAEQDQWKKLGLIQDLTDLSKYQTGSDVANAVGDKLASSVLQKYTGMASKMSPADLMGSIQKEMSGITSGMQAMKDELAVSDDTLKAYKQMYPELDIAALSKMIRADVVDRRMKGDAFLNPLEIRPSQLNINDPEILSRFVADDKGLVSAIVNPKGTEPQSVLMGKQGDYTKFEGKLPYWKRPNYDRAKFNPEGFYTGRDIPSFVTKATEIPANLFSASGGKPVKVIDEDVYDQFTADGGQLLSLLSATRKKYPNYDSLNSEEKKYAQRNVLYDKIETLDQSQLQPVQNVRPPVTHSRSYTTVNVGGGSGASKVKGNVLDGFPDVQTQSGARFEGGMYYDKDGNPGSGTVFLTKEYMPALLGGVLKASGIDPENLSEGVNVKVKDGVVVSISNSQIGNVTREEMENVYQRKFDTEPLKGSPLSFPEPKQKSGGGGYKIKGKNYTEQELLKMGYTLDQIKPYKQ